MPKVIERVARLEEQYDAIMQRFDKVEREIARVDGRLDSGLAEVKQSLAHVETRLDTGLASLAGRLDSNMSEVRTSIVHLGDRLDSGLGELRAEMRTQFRWFMGGLGGAVLAMLLTIFSQTIFGR